MSVHAADLYPRLDLKDAAERRAPTYARVEGKRGVLGNGFLELRFDSRQPFHETAAITNKLSGDTLGVEFVPFEAQFDFGAVSSAEMRLRQVEARQAVHVSALVSHLSFEWFDLELSYVIQRGDHFISKFLAFHNIKKPMRMHRLSLFKHRVAPQYAVVPHDAGMYFPVVFIRGQQGSLFFCMDFPGIFVEVDGQEFNFAYYPGQDLEPGRGFQSSLAHVGVAAAMGRLSANPYHETSALLDEGEKQWFREYLLRGGPVAELPYVEAVAPATDVAGASDLEAIGQCVRLGANHVILPRFQKDPDAYPQAETVKERLREAGVHPALRLCDNTAEDLRWVALAPDGSSAGRPRFNGCLASREYCNAVIAHCEGVMERHGYKSVEVQGSPVVECHAPGHNHLPGVESLQRAFQGLVEITEAIRENGARVSCSGPYGSYGAGLARLFDSISPVAPEHPLALPDIHPGRLFADASRLYFRRSHSFLLPKEKIPNTIGLSPGSCTNACYPGASSYPWYLYHDSAGWRYALISAIATGLRHRFEALPPDIPEDDIVFARKWLAWERERLDDLRGVEEILGAPGLDAVDGYSYTSARGAVVFLFNSSYDPQEVRLRLHLTHDSEYVVRELYPREINCLGPNGGLFRRDSEIALTLEPKEARVLEAVRRSPASAKRKRPEIFGAESIEGDGYVTLRGKPGGRAFVGIRTPNGFHPEEIRFPGRTVSPHITEWMCAERSFEEGRKALLKGGFPGRHWTCQGSPVSNAWLRAQVYLPEELREDLDTSPFELRRPVWAYPRRLFFVVRFEVPRFFDPIRTSSEMPGMPEAMGRPLPMKYGIDLAPLNIGLRAWTNGKECEVYPAVAAWDGYAPNSHPVVAYFFEAGSRLDFGRANHVILFARHFDPSAFRGIYMEHLPVRMAEKALEVS